MTKQIINLGQTANDRTGDPLRTAFEKVNSNFDELYARTGDDIQIPALTGNSGKYLTTNGTTLSWATVSSGADLGKFVINGGNILATVNDEVPGAFGSYNINIDPGGESSAGISIPSVPNQVSGGTLQIFNTSSSGGKIMMTTYGGMTVSSARGTLGLGLDLEAPGVPNHFHVAFETSNQYIPTADLYFGDDYNYLRLVNAAQGVFIGTNNRSGGDQHQWRFQTDGNLTLPSGGGSSSFTATTSTGVSGDSKEFASGGSVDSVTTSWTATGGGIVGTAAITNVTVGLSFTFVTFDQSFTATGPITFSSGENNTSGSIIQRTTRTVTKGITTVEADTSGIVFSANAWQTGFKLIIMVETRLDNNTDDVDHTQVCEAVIAANYNSSTEPSMSVYGLTYTSPNPLATFTVQRTGYTGSGSGTIEVVATNVQTQYNLQVSVHAIQFGSFYD